MRFERFAPPAADAKKARIVSRSRAREAVTLCDGLAAAVTG